MSDQPPEFYQALDGDFENPLQGLKDFSSFLRLLSDSQFLSPTTIDFQSCLDLLIDLGVLFSQFEEIEMGKDLNPTVRFDYDKADLLGNPESFLDYPQRKTIFLEIPKALGDFVSSLGVALKQQLSVVSKRELFREKRSFSKMLNLSNVVERFDNIDRTPTLDCCLNLGSSTKVNGNVVYPLLQSQLALETLTGLLQFDDFGNFVTKFAETLQQVEILGERVLKLESKCRDLSEKNQKLQAQVKKFRSKYFISCKNNKKKTQV